MKTAVASANWFNIRHVKILWIGNSEFLNVSKNNNHDLQNYFAVWLNTIQIMHNFLS